MFLLRIKLIMQGEKRETSTKTCNETMLRDKLRVFVSHISPPLATTFFNPQQMFLLRDKLITHGEKRETSTKTCNKTMLRDKLRVFVSRISPP